MKHIIEIKKIIGEKPICEDALLIKREVMNNLQGLVVLDFDGVHEILLMFFYCLFSELLYNSDRNYILSHVEVKNLTNEDVFRMVVRGTAA